MISRLKLLIGPTRDGSVHSGSFPEPEKTSFSKLDILLKAIGTIDRYLPWCTVAGLSPEILESR